MRSGTKTVAPTEYEKALKIYEKLVLSKTAKGYSEDGDGIAFAGTENANRVTGYQPQLLNEVELEDIIAMVQADPGKWVAQEKFDGERRGLKVEGGKIVGANRKGLEVPVRKEIEAAVAKIVAQGVSDFEVDCEDMGGWYAVFDLLSINGEDLRGYVAAERLDRLDAFYSNCKDAGIDRVLREAPTFELDGPGRIEKLVAELGERKAEGLVFKRLDAAYEAGRPNSGGTQLKLKFTHDITVRVKNHTEGKRSVGMEMLHDGVWTGVGKVTIPANHYMPAVGDLIDVQYLYAFKGGSLFQPILRGKRTDYDEADCTTEKLVYKADPTSDLEPTVI